MIRFLSFFLSFFALLLNQIFFPHFLLLAFAPFCALVIQTKPWKDALWAAALVGLLYDCLSTTTHFGLYSLCYGMTALIALGLKHRSVASSLPLFTMTLSAIFAAVHLLLFQSFFNLLAVASSLFLMPIADGLYAFFWHAPPLLLYSRWQEART